MPALGKVAAAVVLLLAVAVLGYYLYTEYQRVQALSNLKVYLVDVRVVSVGLTSATLELKLKLYNPAGVSVTIDRVVYTLYGDGNYVGEGSVTERVEVPAGGEKMVTSRLDVTYAGLARAIYEFITRGGRLTWKAKGTIYVPTLFGTQTASFEVTA